MNEIGANKDKMLSFKQFILVEESKFGPKDWSKHDNKYSLAVIDDLLAGKDVDVHSGSVSKIGETVTLDDFDREKLIKIRHQLVNIYGPQPTVDDFNAAVTNPNIKAKLWSNLAKVKYNGLSGTQKAKVSDDTGEIGFMLAVDMLIQHNKFVNFDQYKPSNLVHCASEEDLQKAIDQLKQLSSNDNWIKSNRGSASLICKKYPEILQGKYEMHHKTNLYNKIRKIGAKLSKIAEDKWNPADMIFVRKGVTLDISKTDNIAEYNDYIGDMKNFIPVSLKKDAVAIQGAIAASTYLDQLGLKPLTHLNGTQAALKAIKKYLGKVADNGKLKTIVKINPVDETFVEYLNDEEKARTFKPNSGTFSDALPPAIEFMLNAAQGSQDTFENIIQGAYIASTSRTPLSCNHWKAMGTSLKFMNCRSSVGFRLDEVLIPMNGTSRVYFNISVREMNSDGHEGEWEQQCLVCRSKQYNRFPDFNVVYRNTQPRGTVYHVDDFVQKFLK